MKIKDSVNGSRTQADENTKEEKLVISKPNIKIVTFKCVGIRPLILNKFSAKAQQIIQDTQKAGSTAKGKKKREAKDFEQCYKDAIHTSVDGWKGIHAASFRKGMIDACRLTGFAMTKAKLAVFVLADGYDIDGTPLVKITKGEPRMVIHPVRNANGSVDMRARPQWDEWECRVTIRFDADVFTTGDILNLLARLGLQCGIGEGRPNSKDSAGMDNGLFEVYTDE